MRLRRVLLVSALLAAAVVGLPAAAQGEGAEGVPTCPDGSVMLRGRIFDDATGLPVTTATGVEFSQPDGTPIDGGSADATGRWYTCFDQTETAAVKIRFVPDEYRPEWWRDAANVNTATVVDIPAAPHDPIVLNARVTPQGRVLAGRVTNLAGQPRFASVGIWRRTALGWRPVDGLGTIGNTGIWSFRVPTFGQYRINALVDHHWGRWYRSVPRFVDATTVTVGPSTTFVSDLDIRVPYCLTGPAFCIPPGFNP